MQFQALGKWLIVVGIFIVLIGVALQFLHRIPYIGRLPGDILVKRDNVTFYFPITTCILISVVLMLVSHFFRK